MFSLKFTTFIIKAPKFESLFKPLKNCIPITYVSDKAHNEYIIYS